jgi:hypothetical protein
MPFAIFTVSQLRSMDTPSESSLLAPAKRRKTAAGEKQQQKNWRATASQNLSKTSSSSGSSGYEHQQTHKRNESRFQLPQQQNFFDNQCVQGRKSTSDDFAARDAFVDFLQDLLTRKSTGAEVHMFVSNVYSKFLALFSNSCFFIN